MRTGRDRADDLLTLARHDLRIADLALPEDDGYNVVCFLAQQATEKAIKAVLAVHNVDFPKTHDLQMLLALCSDVAPEATNFVAEAEDLGDYGVTVRYDIRLYPSREQAEGAVATAHRVYDWARRLMEARARDGS